MNSSRFRAYTKRHLSPSFLNSLSITTQIVIVNVFTFLAFLISFSFYPNLLPYVALQPAAILAGKYWWTFIASMFMHGGFLHLFVNMFSLFSIGTLVERLLGKKRYLQFYIFSGLFAGLFLSILVLYLYKHSPCRNVLL